MALGQAGQSVVGVRSKNTLYARELDALEPGRTSADEKSMSTGLSQRPSMSVTGVTAALDLARLPPYSSRAGGGIINPGV